MPQMSWTIGTLYDGPVMNNLNMSYSSAYFDCHCLQVGKEQLPLFGSPYFPPLKEALKNGFNKKKLYIPENICLIWKTDNMSTSY